VAGSRKLADYRIDREISRSSIASIYQGYQESLNRKVLIKSLHPQLVGDNEIRVRFEREAHALARIKHKNIVHIYDYKADDSQAVLVSEWIDGGSVEEYIKKHGPLTEKEAIALGLSVLEGLSVAHKKGIIHRDIKPDNLLIAITGVLKITDFGLAQFEGAPSVTQQGVAMGTPSYIAPELVSGEAADQRSDLYNLGVTLYELLTGTNPFQADNLSQTLNNVVSIRPEHLSGITPEFNSLLMSLMAKQPNRRPNSADEVLEVIKPLAAKFGIKRGWEDVFVPKDIDGENLPSDSSKKKTTIQPIKKNKPNFYFVVSAIVLMALVPIFVWFFGTEEKAPVSIEETSFPDTTQVAIEPEGSSIIPVDVPNNNIRTTIDTNEDQISDEQLTNQAPIQEDVKETIIQPVVDLPDTNVSIFEESGINHETITEEEQRVSKDPGYLYLYVRPWANIYFENDFLIQTPYDKTLKLPSGSVTLSLINPEFPPLEHTVKISPNDTSSVRINLFEKVGIVSFIDAVPWAEIYLDNEYLGRTPIGKAIYLSPGEHTVVYRHPTLHEKSVDFEISAGDPPLRLRENLTK